MQHLKILPLRWKAEKVQFLPQIFFSTCSIMLSGIRIVLLVVEGMEGILNFFISCLQGNYNYKI